MNSINKWTCFLCFSIVVLSACSRDGGSIEDLFAKPTPNTNTTNGDDNNNSNPTASNEISVSETSLSFTAEGESKNVSVTSNFSWETIDKPSWITISPSSGTKGTTNLTVTASKSSSTTSRTGTITFGKSSSATTSISVSQAATSSSVSYSGSDKTFTVMGNGRTVTFKMIYVEGGTFTMGPGNDRTGDEDYYDSSPSHIVTLSDFSMGQTEVTQALWEAVMGTNPSYFKGINRPVESVSWSECQDFINQLSLLTDWNFSMPTEAEWEFAARGGNQSNGYRYAGSNNIYDVGWIGDNSGSQTHDVAKKKANELGLYDMCGNVYEWCQDWYDDYSTVSQYNPIGPSSSKVSCRIIRGGSWYENACNRVWSRMWWLPNQHPTFCGFRLVLR